MRIITLGVMIMAASVLSVGAYAQPTLGHFASLAIEAAKAPQALAVTSPDFAPGGDMAIDNTLYGANRFPGLAWSKGPAGTRSYVVVVQGKLDGGPGRAPNTSIHLTLYNLPATVASLPAGMTAAPAGASYGENVHGMQEPYSGPHTHGPVKHEYHFQVLALDTVVPPGPPPTLAMLMNLARGHVLAGGDVFALSAMPASATTPQGAVDK